ncbi:MAG: flavodoxin family protein [Terracidiphilus sp.]|nr:flavodoxin family protein [Terracidiphilus sp.]
MKTVTAFVGSARKRGLTYIAARQFLDSLESFGDVNGEIVFLSEYNVGVCRGCKACFLRGEERCPLKDDRDVLIEKIMASDGVVFASPNYSFQVSAIMKTFLDRLGFVFHRPRFHGKTFTGIVAQGIYGGGKVVKYFDFVGGGLGFNVVKGSCVTALEPMVEKDRRKMYQTIVRQSKRFHAQLFRPTHPEPSTFQLMAFRMSRTSMKLTLGDDNRDYTYYRDHGWFDSGYYYPAKLGPFKRAVGAIFDCVAARMFKPTGA